MQAKSPLIFGEVLFDIFKMPQKTDKAIGGAPFNVAWHLKGFGLDPILYTRIGNDELGREILAYMNDWGLNTDYVQIDEEYPTGEVQVVFAENSTSHHFDILNHQAYDYIDYREIPQNLRDRIALIYHGSLALRNPKSLSSINQLKESLQKPVFVDINLRSPWWTNESILSLIQGADIVKMNEDEFGFLYNEKFPTDESIAAVQTDSPMDFLITLGAEGVFYKKNSKSLVKSNPAKVKQIVDTVGAGDSVSSIFLLGHIMGWDFETTLNRAVEFASRVCEHRGALFHDKTIYENFAKDWGFTMPSSKILETA